ncbi:hypothetical protein INR49_014540 [Caranx melampygus]|nr:hypothetical protein INR49_014540 [Caranx melampygus]
MPSGLPTLVYLLYKICTITSCILGYSLLLVLSTVSTIGLIILWVLGTVWTHYLQTTFCSSKGLEFLYRAVIGAILTFTFFNVKGQDTKVAMTIYYIFHSALNIMAPILLALLKPELQSATFFWTVSGLIIGGSLLGLLNLVVYYLLLHPKGKWREADEGEDRAGGADYRRRRKGSVSTTMVDHTAQIHCDKVKEYPIPLCLASRWRYMYRVVLSILHTASALRGSSSRAAPSVSRGQRLKGLYLDRPAAVHLHRTGQAQTEAIEGPPAQACLAEGQCPSEDGCWDPVYPLAMHCVRGANTLVFPSLYPPTPTPSDQPLPCPKAHYSPQSLSPHLQPWSLDSAPAPSCHIPLPLPCHTPALMDGRGHWFSCGVQACGLHGLPSSPHPNPSARPPPSTFYYSCFPLPLG